VTKDYDKAFPYFVVAAKHGDPEGCFRFEFLDRLILSLYLTLALYTRAGECCEYGWGTKKDGPKAIQFYRSVLLQVSQSLAHAELIHAYYRKAATASHPDAMLRLGLAELNGDLGMPRKTKDGFKWLKRCAAIVEDIEKEGSTAEVPLAR
jgi:TPR repeat protein